MGRRLLFRGEHGQFVLHETAADHEAQLQELIRDHPELLSVQEFGMPEPLLIVGKETVVPSGAIDLVGVSRNGELVLAEFKTGPQNADFRSSIAQLLDYGSDLWGKPLGEFEQLVPIRYFNSTHCNDSRFKGVGSLQQAAKIAWSDISEGEFAELSDHLSQQLRDGQFHYVLLAQRFTEPVTRTLEYLNSTSKSLFYAVEVVRFNGDGLDAFETRVVLKPSSSPNRVSPANAVNETQLIESISDETYADAVRELFQVARASGLRFHWGSIGVSIRVPVPDHTEPVSIAWLFPPGRSGWSGFTDLTLGFDRSQAKRSPSSQPALAKYVEAVSLISVGEVEHRGVEKEGFHFSPAAVVSSLSEIREAIVQLAMDVNGGSMLSESSE